MDNYKKHPLVVYLNKRMEEEGLRQTDLVRFFGSRSRVSEFFAGTRSVSFTTAARLYRWGVPADILFDNANLRKRARSK